MGDRAPCSQTPGPRVIPFPRRRRAPDPWRVRLAAGTGLVLAVVPGVFLVTAAHNRVQQTVLAFGWLALVSLAGWTWWLWASWRIREHHTAAPSHQGQTR
ncbi:MAG: hypothetical protein M1516_01720, partial [Firmicutes bacterium]|nr:hypothetical protein [Bacillota bacterium]